MNLGPNCSTLPSRKIVEAFLTYLFQSVGSISLMQQSSGVVYLAAETDVQITFENYSSIKTSWMLPAHSGKRLYTQPLMQTGLK